MHSSTSKPKFRANFSGGKFRFLMHLNGEDIWYTRPCEWSDHNGAPPTAMNFFRVSSNRRIHHPHESGSIDFHGRWCDLNPQLNFNFTEEFANTIRALVNLHS